MVKFYLYRRSNDRIKQVTVCCHSNNIYGATKIFQSPASLNASMNLRTLIILELFIIMLSECCHYTPEPCFYHCWLALNMLNMSRTIGKAPEHTFVCGLKKKRAGMSCSTQNHSDQTSFYFQLDVSHIRYIY